MSRWEVHSHQWILAHFPKDYANLRYFEGCGGAASVLLNKNKSIEETYNDADPKIASIVTILASPEYESFLQKLKVTYYTQFIFDWSRMPMKQN